MRILFVSAYGPWGRPNSFIKAQSDSLKSIGLDVTDFYFTKRGILGNLKCFLLLKRFLKQNGPFDIVHCHFSYTALFAHLARSKSRLIVSFMGTDLMGCLNNKGKLTLKGRFNRILSWFVQTKMDSIIVKSEQMLAFIHPKYYKITSVVPNGIDFEKFCLLDKKVAQAKLSLDHKKKYILFLGDPQSAIKNFKIVNEAYAALQNNNVKLLCPYPVKSEDVSLYLNACDVLAFSSLQEGSPNVVKEALACNCPVVATDVGDVSERLSNLEGCYISSFETSDFTSKLRSALSFDKRTNGRLSIRHLDMQKTALRIKQIYQQLNVV